MGSTLNRQLAAFLNELGALEKEAGVEKLFPKLEAAAPAAKGIVGRVGEYIKQLVGKGAKRTKFDTTALGLSEPERNEFFNLVPHPTKIMAKGWNNTSNISKEPIRLAREALAKGGPEEYQKMLGTLTSAEAAVVHNSVSKAPHLVEPSRSFSSIYRGENLEGKGRIRATGEELSRRGWFGAGESWGGVGKYLPVGTKGQIALMGASTIPDIVHAQQASPTGEGGRREAVGSLVGSTLGMIGGSGMGMVPGMAMWYAGNKIGKGLGRTADRLGAGASPMTALTAPSPSEATSQLEKIRKYYG